jgi:HAD superfamily hydrolase (TIGR01549 family)
MIRAVLLDLDDTLLDNKMDIFLPAYFQKLGEYLSDLLDPAEMLTELLAGTQEMIGNMDPTRTLERAFAEYFYPALGLDEGPLREHFEIFYQQVFPSLESLTGFRPEAKPFVDEITLNGQDLVVATNPLFPYIAVEERLAWAGFDTPEDIFQVITTYEHFHFTKPHPEYYAEILGHLGIAPFEVVMIGDDPMRDLAPATILGIGAFHLSEDPEEAYDGGDFEAARLWIEKDQPKSPRENAKSPEAILARARGCLGAMMTMMEPIDEDACSIAPFEGEWSLGEIMCHLRDVEREVHLDRLVRILEEDNAHLVGEDTDAWAEIRQYDCQPGMEAFSAFVSQRLELIAKLEKLDAKAWERPARHTLLGPMRLNEVMAIANDHDTIHLAQLRKTLGALRT